MWYPIFVEKGDPGHANFSLLFMIFFSYLTFLLAASFVRCSDSSSSQPKVTSITDAIRLVEETHGSCSTQEITEFMHDSALFEGTKFVLDLDLFAYLAKQTEPQPIVHLAEDLTRALLTHIHKSPMMVENRAVVKVFLNFELMAERLILMKSFSTIMMLQADFHANYLQKVAACKLLCIEGIKSTCPFLFRSSFEVSRLTMCRRVREYSFGLGDKFFQTAFPSEAIILEHVKDMLAFKSSSSNGLEASSNVQRLHSYLQLGNILKDAVAKDYIVMPFIFWLNTLCCEISGLPEYYQNIIYQEVTKASPKFLLSYMETAFPEDTLLRHFARGSSTSISSIAKRLDALPTLRLKYLYLTGVFFKLFKTPSKCVISSVALKKRIVNALTFVGYGSDQCFMRRYFFGAEKEQMIILGVLNLSNDEEKDQLNTFRETIRGEMSPELKEFLAIPQVYNLLFIHYEDVEHSLLLTFDNIKPFQSDFLSMRRNVLEDINHIFPNFKEKLIASKETNKLDVAYVKQVALGTFSKLLGRMLDDPNNPNEGTMFAGSLSFINKHSSLTQISLFQETMPEKSSLKKNAHLQNRLFFIIHCMAEYVIRKQLSECEKLECNLKPHEEITDPVELLVHLEGFNHDNKNEQEESLSLIQKLPVDSSKRQLAINAYVVLLKSKGINPNIVLPQYIAESKEPEPQTRGVDLWNYAIQQLLVLLEKQYSCPSEDHESNILTLLRTLYHEGEENEYWQRTKQLMRSIQELAVEVGLFNFSTEGLRKLVDTLDIDLQHVMKPARSLPLDRRQALMDNPLFSVQFKTFLIQNVCLNVLSVNYELKDEQQHSKTFIMAHMSNIAMLSLISSSMRDRFFAVSTLLRDSYPTLKRVIRGYLTVTKAVVRNSELEKCKPCIDEAVSFMEIGLIRGFVSSKVCEYVSATFAYVLLAEKLPLVRVSSTEYGHINIKPACHLVEKRRNSPSWRIAEKPIIESNAGEEDDEECTLEFDRTSFTKFVDSLFTVRMPPSDESTASNSANTMTAQKSLQPQGQVEPTAKNSSHLCAAVPLEKEEKANTITNPSSLMQLNSEEKKSERESHNPTRPSRSIRRNHTNNKNTTKKNKQKTSNEKSKASNDLVEKIAQSQAEKGDTSCLKAIKTSLQEDSNHISDDPLTKIDAIEDSLSKKGKVDLTTDRKTPPSVQDYNTEHSSVQSRKLKALPELLCKSPKPSSAKKPVAQILISKDSDISSQPEQKNGRISASNTSQRKSQALKESNQTNTDSKPTNIGRESSNKTAGKKDTNLGRKGATLPNHSEVPKTLNKSSYATALNLKPVTSQVNAQEAKSLPKEPMVKPQVEAKQAKSTTIRQPTYWQKSAEKNATEQLNGAMSRKSKTPLKKKTFRSINDPLMNRDEKSTQYEPSKEPLRKTSDYPKEIPSELLKVGMKQSMARTEMCSPNAPSTDVESHSWHFDSWQDVSEDMLEFMFTPSQSSIFSFSPIHYVYRFDQQTIVDRYFSPNPSLNSEIFTLDRLNAKDLDVLLLLLQHATSVAIDFEMRGVKAKNGGSTVEGVKEHKVFQMGLCIVKKKDGVDYVSTWRINACENGQLEEHMFNKESLEFLKKSLGENFVKDLRPILLDYSTLRAIFNEIQARNVPVIVHNGYADLLHVSKIMGEDISGITFDNFTPLFSSINDSKYLCKELNEVYKGKNMTESIIWDTKLETLMATFYPLMVKCEEKKMHDGAYDALATYLVYSGVIKRLQALHVDYHTIPRKLFKMVHF